MRPFLDGVGWVGICFSAVAFEFIDWINLFRNVFVWYLCSGDCTVHIVLINLV